MNHYNFTQTFRAVYDRAIKAYEAGARSASKLLSAADVRWLESIGSRAQDMFDYAEDAADHGEPDFDTALLIQSLRRDYFLNVQGGIASRVVLDSASLPAKSETVRGIEWLPRILPKARAKLRGELPQDTMYCCGGDRHFFQTNDIHPAEFLRLIWTNEGNDAATIDWVEQRAKATNALPA